MKVAIHTKKVAYKAWIQRKFESSLHALYNLGNKIQSWE